MFDCSGFYFMARASILWCRSRHALGLRRPECRNRTRFADAFTQTSKVCLSVAIVRSRVMGTPAKYAECVRDRAAHNNKDTETAASSGNQATFSTSRSYRTRTRNGPAGKIPMEKAE